MTTVGQEVTERIRIEADLKFIKNDLEWPHWPLLPLKHANREAHEKHYLGLMLGNKKPWVILATLYDFDRAFGDTWKERIEGFEIVKYNSFEELLREWRID